MTGGAATAVVDQVGHQHFQGLGILLPTTGRAQRPPRVFRPGQGRREHVDHGRDGRRSRPPQPSLLLRIVGTERRAPGHFQHLHGTDRRDAQRRLQRGARAEPDLPDLRPRHRHLRRQEPLGVRGRCDSGQIASARSRRKSRRSYPAPNNPGTNNGLQNNLFIPRSPRPIATTTTSRSTGTARQPTRSGPSSR